MSNNILKLNEDNLGGAKLIRFIDINEVTAVPEPVDQTIIDPVELATGAEWNTAEFTTFTLGFNEQQVLSDGGTIAWEATVQGQVPKDRPSILDLLTRYHNKRVLAQVEDRNGLVRLLGTIEEPARLLMLNRTTQTQHGQRNHTVLQVQLTRRDPAPFYNVPWERSIALHWIARNDHHTFSEDEQDAIIAAIGPGTAVYTEFGPDGSNQQDSRFMLHFHLSQTSAVGTGMNNTGQPFKWHIDGTTYTQDNFPAHTLGGNPGTVICTSSDLFTNTIAFNLAQIPVSGYMPKLILPNADTISFLDCDLSGTEPGHEANPVIYDIVRCNMSGAPYDHQWSRLEQYRAAQNSFSDPMPQLAASTGLEHYQVNNNTYTFVHASYTWEASATIFDFASNPVGVLYEYNMPNLILMRGYSTSLTVAPPLLNYPSLIAAEFYSCPITGAVGNYSHLPNLTQARFQNCNITSYAGGGINNGRQIHFFYGNAWPSASVNAYLADCVAATLAANSDIALNAGTMGAPTGQGITDKNVLIAAGHIVTTN